MDTRKKHLRSKKLTKQVQITKSTENFQFDDTKFEEVWIGAHRNPNFEGLAP